jgi:hypothetical protein
VLLEKRAFRLCESNGTSNWSSKGGLRLARPIRVDLILAVWNDSKSKPKKNILADTYAKVGHRRRKNDDNISFDLTSIFPQSKVWLISLVKLLG